MLPKGNTVNFSHFYFTFIAKIAFKSHFYLMFIIVQLWFNLRIYSNIKRKYTDAIQNINKKRFAIYLKTENSCFRQRKRNWKENFWKAWFVYARGRDSIHELVYSTDDSTEGKWKCFLIWLCYKRNGKRCTCATIELWMHAARLPFLNLKRRKRVCLVHHAKKEHLRPGERDNLENKLFPAKSQRQCQFENTGWKI